MDRGRDKDFLFGAREPNDEDDIHPAPETHGFWIEWRESGSAREKTVYTEQNRERFNDVLKV